MEKMRHVTGEEIPAYMKRVVPGIKIFAVDEKGKMSGYGIQVVQSQTAETGTQERTVTLPPLSGDGTAVPMQSGSVELKHATRF